MSANRELIVCLQGRELKECGNRVFVNGALEFAHPEVCTINICYLSYTCVPNQ